MNEIKLIIIDSETDDTTYTLNCSKSFFGALLVMSGKFGNGSERAAALKKAGFNPQEVQTAVNEIVGVI